jgi:hypothetical protein
MRQRGPADTTQTLSLALSETHTHRAVRGLLNLLDAYGEQVKNQGMKQDSLVPLSFPKGTETAVEIGVAEQKTENKEAEKRK